MILTRTPTHKSTALTLLVMTWQPKVSLHNMSIVPPTKHKSTESDNDSGKQSDKATDNDAEGSTAEGLLPLMERPNGHSKAPPKGRRGPMMRSKKPVAAASSIDDDNSLPPAKKLAASQKGGCAGWAAVGNGPMSKGPARSSTPFEVSNRIRELERQLQEEKGKRCY